VKANVQLVFGFSFLRSHHLVSHWASSWVIRCLILAGNYTSAASLLSQKCLRLSPATIAQQRSHQSRSSFAPRRPLQGYQIALLTPCTTLTLSAGTSVDWLHLFVDSDLATEVALAGSIGCSPLDFTPSDMHSILGNVPLALQASCLRMVLSLFRSGLYQASSACVRALVGCGSSEAMSIPRPILAALEALPGVTDMTVDERSHALGMASINAWNRNSFDSFDGHLCHGPPDLCLFSRAFTRQCCAALASALACSVRITSLFLDGSTLADSGCSALCSGLASNESLLQLSLCNCKITAEACRDLRIFLATAGGPPLQVLDISGNSVLDSGIALIGDSMVQGSLIDVAASVHHSSCESTAGDPSRRKSSVPPVLSLRVFRASNCAFGKDGVSALCRGAQAASCKGYLHTLVLSRNPLGQAGVGYVAWLVQTQGNCIKCLDIEGCAAAGVCASALAASLNVAVELEKSCKIPVLVNGLKQGENLFFVDGVAYDVNGCVIEHVTEAQPEFKLLLDTVRIGGHGDGVAAEDNLHGIGELFCSAGRCSSIVTLSITSSHISRCLELHALQLFKCKTLRSLTLDGCFISPGGARAVAQGLVSGACLLQYLSVQGCQLGDIGTGHLESVWTQSAGPATFKISSNGIHDRGAMHLSRIISSGSLRALFVDDNSIGPIGFEFMSRALVSAASRVQSFHISNNNAGSEGACALFRSLSLKEPLQIVDPVIDPEEFFVSTRGTRVPREMADLQKEHRDSSDEDYMNAKRILDKSRRLFAESAAATATSHGQLMQDANEYISGNVANDCMRWNWLECLEMRNNNAGAGCEEDLVAMIQQNSTLQVVLVCNS
jgi:hypothetical protein